LLPAVAGTEIADRASEVIAAARALVIADDTIVLVTPHGARPGIYRSVRGSLGPHGAPHVGVEAETDRSLIDALATSSGLPVIDDPLDHGGVVPLLLLGRIPRTVVAASISTETEAKALVDALVNVAPDDVSFVASVTTSAALDPSAPLTYRPEADRVEQRLLESLPIDAASAADLAGELARAGGSCSAAPLVAFGILFGGCSVDIRAYQHPFGVGYLVAATERDA
jgi:aromatic ring-opening dioxygenase LigB subunit